MARMQRCRIALGAALLLMLPACQHPQPKTLGGLMDVTEVEVPSAVRAGSYFTVVIRGVRPDPAWNVIRLEIATASSEVTLSVYGKRDPAIMAAQVIGPFVTTQRMRKLKPGTLRLVIQGRRGSIRRMVQVLPAAGGS